MESMRIENGAAALCIEVNGYQVTVTITSANGKPVTDRTVRLAVTKAMEHFPQLITQGDW